MNTNQLARIGGLVGEPARAGMLLALMDGRALTATELATVARIASATASRHLALLVEAGLLRVRQQGRHRYHQLASAEVARMLEGILQLAVAQPRAPLPLTGPRDASLRFARTCYDHLAGRLAVALADRLVELGAVRIEGETAVVTERAGEALHGLGLQAALQPHGERPPCRPCLDWGERRVHLAGRLGTLLCAHCMERGWLLRRPGTRSLELMPAGAVAFRQWLGAERWQVLTLDDERRGAPAAPAPDRVSR